MASRETERMQIRRRKDHATLGSHSAEPDLAWRADARWPDMTCVCHIESGSVRMNTTAQWLHQAPGSHVGMATAYGGTRTERKR